MTDTLTKNKDVWEYLDKRAVDGVPILNSGEFQYVTNTWGKEAFRETLSIYIAEGNSEYPLKKISKDTMIHTFKRLQKARYDNYIYTAEDYDVEVLEKFEDYKYSYKEYGLGIIDTQRTFNDASDYFMKPLRLACSSYGFKSPIEVWTKGSAKEIWRSIGAIWRGINDCFFDENGKCTGGALPAESYIAAFRLGTYVATQFKPIVAKVIYEMADAEKVLDTSMGWGDRLTGFFASTAKEYIGCDPNPNTFAVYKKMAIDFSEIIGNNIEIIEDSEDKFQFKGRVKSGTFYRSGAENLPWDEINEIDCAFTSPPYFSTERYNEGGEKAEDQSWAKFNEYERWRDDFYLPVARNSFNALSDKGFMLTNIIDPKVHNVRYRSCDELVDELKDNFIGQIGMRIMQRPQGKNKYETKEDLLEFFGKTYIENVWCFAKSKDPIDLFREKRVNTIESFFG